MSESVSTEGDNEMCEWSKGVVPHPHSLHVLLCIVAEGPCIWWLIGTTCVCVVVVIIVAYSTSTSILAFPVSNIKRKHRQALMSDLGDILSEY